MTIYETLCGIVDNNPGHLTAYKNDLHVIDKGVLESVQPGSRYLWVLRECGTQLFEIASGHQPIWVTYWLTPGNLAYLVDVDSGKVEPISHDKARELAQTPHPAGKVVHVSIDRGQWETYPS